MDGTTERPYVDPATEPGDQGTEPWADGDAADDASTTEASPAERITGGSAAGLDDPLADGSADKPAS